MLAERDPVAGLEETVGLDREARDHVRKRRLKSETDDGRQDRGRRHDGGNVHVEDLPEQDGDDEREQKGEQDVPDEGVDRGGGPSLREKAHDYEKQEAKNGREEQRPRQERNVAVEPGGKGRSAEVKERLDRDENQKGVDRPPSERRERAPEEGPHGGAQDEGDADADRERENGRGQISGNPQEAQLNGHGDSPRVRFIPSSA